MSNNNTGTGMTKADLILRRLEQLAQQNSTLAAQVNALSQANAARGGETKAASDSTIKQEMNYLSVQIESVYNALTASVNKLSQEVAALKNADRTSASDVDDIASKVAAKIVIPEAAPVEIDADEIAGKVADRIPATQSVQSAVPENMDYDAIGLAVAKNIHIPQAIAEDVDYDKIAEKLSEKFDVCAKDGDANAKSAAVPENMDYDAIGLAVAKSIYVPQAIAEDIDYDQLAEKLAAKLDLSAVADAARHTSEAQLDYDMLADKVAEKLSAKAEEAQPVKEQSQTEVAAMPADADYDAIGLAVAKNIHIPQAVAEDIDYDQLAEKLAEKMPAMQIDGDALAVKIAQAVGVQDTVSPDYIASKVSEQVVVPVPDMSEALSSLDIEALSRKVADKIALPQAQTDADAIACAVVNRINEEKTEEPAVQTEQTSALSAIDEGALAEDIAAKLNLSLSDEIIASAVVRNLAGAIDSDEIADCVAKRVGTISPEEFEITVDDDGCESLADSIEAKLDYEKLASAVAEKILPAVSAAGGHEVDAEELSKNIAEKLNVGAINEDALADKAAAILSNYLPEVDSTDIADKVVAGIIPVLPAAPAVDSDAIAAAVSEKLVENQENSDYDIVIDEEGLARITDGVAEGLRTEYAARFDKIDGDIASVKEESIARLEKLESASGEIREEYNARFDGAGEESGKLREDCNGRLDRIEKEIAQLKALLAGGTAMLVSSELAAAEAVSEEETDEHLVTVSDLVEGEGGTAEQTATDEVMDEIVDDIDEKPVDDEIMPDGIEEDSVGVDFANMMKYNRSFIARIIQGTDEQKDYYGRVKTALLSYKKVNSNIAWGAERFNKGRETIARFKIRGKTLCLYLALDPNEFATSVYHQVDVSDNKSMHGTPMMVKIKSPLGVKKAIRLIDEMLARRGGIKREIAERDYAAMYPYETIEELIEDGLVKDVSKK